MPKYHVNKTPASRAFTDLVRAALRMAPEALRIGPLLTGDLNLSNTRWSVGCSALCGVRCCPRTLKLIAMRA